MSNSNYPLVVRARLDEPLSRWLWLVKWLLAIPHLIILIFLWIAFFFVAVFAFFAILFTGRYPPGLFDFNLGVLRWTWRVSYYTYDALGTDRYPPFTLDEVPDYPATLHLEYPEQLSRGLVLVKWWLLAIPHYVIVTIFTGSYSGVWYNRSGEWRWGGPPGLIAASVFFAAVALLFTSRYPRGLYDFILGMNRWALRVGAYASLMTDQYPPFRLEQGGDDPADAQLAAQPTAPAPSAPPTEPLGGMGQQPGTSP